MLPALLPSSLQAEAQALLAKLEGTAPPVTNAITLTLTLTLTLPLPLTLTVTLTLTR